MLCPVVIINLLDYVEWKGVDRLHSCFMLMDKKDPEYVLTADLVIHFLSGILHMPLLNPGPENTILVPSQSISGETPQVPMGNVDIITWYLLIPMNLVEAGERINFENALRNIDLSVITPTLDQ